MQPEHTLTPSSATRPRSFGGGMTPLRDVLGVDLRTLALFRVLLGSFLILDLALRARDLTAHYTDFGIMPRDVLVGYLGPGSFSLHMLNGTAAFQAALFLVAGIFALLMIVGWRTRMVTIVSWVFLLSLQNRNTLIHSGEEQLAMVLLFWAMFLPLGARFSIDAALDNSDAGRASPAAKPTNAYFSGATIALLVQGMSMYFFSALLKSDVRWVPDGTAVYFALQLDYIVTPLSLWFRQFETLLQGLTYYVWALEFIGPILIFSPILHRPLRALIMLAFITMHIGFILFLEIGIFPIISIIMNLTFTPGWMWDYLATKIPTARRRDLHIWYDRDCGFCLKTVRLLQTFMFLRDVPVRPAQDDPKMGDILETENSWVLNQGEAIYVKWDAVRHLVACSPIFWPVAKIMALAPFRKLGDRFYLWIADNRPALGQLTNKLMPWRPVRVEPTLIGGIVAGLFLALVTLQNISTLNTTSLRLPDQLVVVRQGFGLYQNWAMFAPHPELSSAWPVIRGELKDGTIVDVYNRKIGEPSTAKPEFVSTVFANYRWRKYLSILEDQTYEDVPQLMALNYGRYLCRRWNADAAPEKQLSTFTIQFNVERTPPPGGTKELTERIVWHHDCFGTTDPLG
jgi:predicted DCC family thiol-disulfide oxidoreductase YuxK